MDGPRVCWEHADMTRLPYPDDSCALVVCTSTRGTLRGRSLELSEAPYHACGQSKVISFAGGLSTLLLLGKRSTVGEAVPGTSAWCA